jgi:cytochrome oxidase assembly protein ShyY1
MSTSRRTPLGAALGGLPATTAHAASWQLKRAPSARTGASTCTPSTAAPPLTAGATRSPACETSPATFTHITQTSGSLQDCYLLLSNLRGHQPV